MRVPQSINDFPQFQLAEPILAGLMRILSRDLTLALTVPVLVGWNEKPVTNKDVKHIDVANSKAEAEPFPSVIIRYSETSFPVQASGSGRMRRLKAEHSFEIVCSVIDEQPLNATIQLLRLQRAVFATIEAAEIGDIWAMEAPETGIELTRQIVSMTATPEGEARGTAIVRRGTIVYKFIAHEIDTRQFPQGDITALVTC